MIHRQIALIGFMLVAMAIPGMAAEAELPVLRWAADPDSNAPYSFYSAADPTKLTGFEAEIIEALAKQMGRRAEFVKNDWDGLIPGLGRGMYDCVICGIEINPDHAREVDFSDPYYYTYEQLVVAQGTPKVESLDELRGKKVGTLDQTAALRILQATGGIDVLTYDQEVNAYADIVHGRLFGVLLDYPIALYYASPNPHLQFTGPPFGQIRYGIAVKKGNTALQAELNDALRELVASGELRRILSKWKLWTPTVANALGQPPAPDGAPTGFENFVQNTAPPTLSERIHRYISFLPLLGRAALVTLQVSILSMMLAIMAGFTLALMRVYGPAPARWLATLYIEIVRGTPLLIQLLIIFYGLPNIGIKLAPMVAGVLGLGLNYAAYEAENYRAGLLAIPRGQMEAARALGMTHFQGLRFVVIPQSFRLVLPPVTNDFISLLKDSSLVSMITIVELTGAYNRLATTYYDYFGTGLLVAAIYLLIGLPFVRLARWTEEHLSIDNRQRNQRPGAFKLPHLGQRKIP